MLLKKRLIDTATMLFMKYGLKSVSMDDISREIGISKKTLYQNVENKQELINESLYEFIKGDHDSIQHILSNKEYDALQQMIQIFKQSIKLLQSISPTVIYDLKKYYKESWMIVENMHIKYVEEIVTNNLIKGKKEGIYRKNIDETVVSMLFVSKMITVIDDKLTKNTNLPIAEIFFQHLLYHLHGIISKDEWERLEDLTVHFKN